jgi:hypothetical protein
MECKVAALRASVVSMRTARLPVRGLWIGKSARPQKKPVRGGSRPGQSAALQVNVVQARSTAQWGAPVAPMQIAQVML